MPYISAVTRVKKNLKIHIWKKNFKTESSTLTIALESTTKSGLLLWSHPDRKVTAREPFLKWLHCLRLSFQWEPKVSYWSTCRAGVWECRFSLSAPYSVLPVEALRPDAAAGARERMEQKHANACNEAF